MIVLINPGTFGVYFLEYQIGNKSCVTGNKTMSIMGIKNLFETLPDLTYTYTHNFSDAMQKTLIIWHFLKRICIHYLLLHNKLPQN